MKLLKSFTKRYLFGVLATIQLYPVFKILHRISLWGMNVGLGGLEDTGESHMLQMLSKNTSWSKSN